MDKSNEFALEQAMLDLAVHSGHIPLIKCDTRQSLLDR